MSEPGYNEKSISLPPNDREAEKAILGAILRDNKALVDVQHKMQQQDFYHFAHGLIWKAFLELQKKGVQLDTITVADWLHTNSAVADIGGYAYLQDLWDSAPAITSVDHLIEIVVSKAMRRDLICLGHGLQEAAFRPLCDVDELVQGTEKRLVEITQRKNIKDDLVHISESVKEFIELIDRRQQRANGGEIEGLMMSGWYALDSILGGFQKGELTLIAARPSVGKTMIACNVLANVAEQGATVFFASLEQRHVELTARLICHKGRVTSKSVRTGEMTPSEQNSALNASDLLKTYGIWYDSTAAQSAAKIMSSARRLSMKASLDMVIVDYVGLMAQENSRGNKTQEVGTNALRMRELAKELNVPVLLLSQLNRGVESRQDSRPKLSDLRDSGNLEEHADCVIMLHKDEDQKDTDDFHTIEVSIKKNRNGPLGQIKLINDRRFFSLMSEVP
jgi:replicative DNA helicase